MRHKYLKSLTLMAIAFIMAIPTKAFEIYVQFTDENGNAISADALAEQPIEACWSDGNGIFERDWGDITLNDNGSFTIRYNETATGIYIPDSRWTIYFKINGFIGLASMKNGSNTEYTARLQRLRVNQQLGAGHVKLSFYTYDDLNRYGEKNTLSVTTNKDYYFPAQIRMYDIFIDVKSYYSDNNIFDLPDYYPVNVNIIGKQKEDYEIAVQSNFYEPGTIYLPEGTYTICAYEKGTSKMLFEEKNVSVSSEQNPNLEYCELTIKVQEPDGMPVEKIRTEFKSNSNNNYYNTDADGLATAYLIKDKNYDYNIVGIYGSIWDVYDSGSIALSGSQTITVTVPKKISFKVMVFGKEYEYGNASESYICTDEDYEYVGCYYSEGAYHGRLDPNKNYHIRCSDIKSNEYDDKGFVRGTTKITDGATICIGAFTVQSEGYGIAFPRDAFSTSSTYYVFEGNPVRLAALPVGDGEFINWNINGKEYTSPMIDFTAKEDFTTATAIFNGGIENAVKGMKSPLKEDISVSIEGGILRFTNEVEGEVAIYSMDGRIVKQVGVVGNQIIISDLPGGPYILSLTSEGQKQSVKFVKP